MLRNNEIGIGYQRNLHNVEGAKTTGLGSSRRSLQVVSKRAFLCYGVLAKASTCTSKSGSADGGIATIVLSGVGGPK